MRYLISDMIIIFNIKSIREKQGITLQQLSLKTGISSTHLCDIENNNKMPSFIYTILIARALKVKINELYTIKRY